MVCDQCLLSPTPLDGLGCLSACALVAVPICDREGHAVAALSVGTISTRLNEERLPAVVDLLRKEAQRVSVQINPFDPTLQIGRAHV